MARPQQPPCFSMEISIDLKKLRSYTPNRQEQCLICIFYLFNTVPVIDRQLNVNARNEKLRDLQESIG
jgi:hypothetical protein